MASARREALLAIVALRFEDEDLLESLKNRDDNAIDDRLPDSLKPDQLALYLGLGFSQATTTHQWPATPRWVTLLQDEERPGVAEELRKLVKL